MGSRHAVRVLSGELEGLVVPIDERLVIGRSSEAHLQLLGRRVSRSHAAIADVDGTHVVTDLMSTNGTYVDGERVSRRTLELGDEIRIGETKLAFERLIVASADRPDPIADEASWEETLAGSAGHDRDDGDAAMAEVATDIVLFRNICMVLARKGQLPPMLEVRHAQLEVRLRTGGGRKRAFRRFPCDCPAELTFEEAEPTPATLVELAVDGARLGVNGHNRAAGDPCLLSVDIKSSQGLRTIAFASRVESASPRELWVRFDDA